MHALKVYRNKSKGVADLLNWAALISDGRILCKDGQIIGGFFYSCKDTASSTESERNYNTARVNTALARLDNHWTITHDAVRVPSSEYPAEHLSHFPDPITRLIETENRKKFLAEGNHFETYYVLTLAYRPPLSRHSKMANLMYDVNATNVESLADQHLAYFDKTLEELADSLNGILTLQKMGSYEHLNRFEKSDLRDELVNYLHFACTGLSHPINIPPIAMYADEYICGQELWVGDIPKIGENFICCVSLEGFPSQSYPNILEILEHLPIAYRWSNRMIMLDQHESVNELTKNSNIITNKLFNY